MTDIDRLTHEVNEFRDERDWRHFHNEKDLALSITLEAAELLELFQWRTADEAVSEGREAMAEELADVLIYSLMMADNLGLDPAEIVRRKLALNAERYPVDQARGSRTKYTALGTNDAGQ